MRERLYRSRRDRVIGGVAGGLSLNLGVDSTWIRVGWVLLAFATQGFAVILYVALLFVIPEADDEPAPAMPRPTESTQPGTDRPANGDTGPGSAALVAGLLLIAAGAWLLLRQFLPRIDLDLGWPFIAIAAGIVLVVVAMRPGRSG